MEKEFIDLFELQHRLKQGVESLFPNRIWVKAEVSAVKARSGGHCYMELSQSDQKGLIAKSSAIIWSSKYRFIAPYFESVTGTPLQEGLVILVQVQVNFSELYGMSLIIDDINPEFSLGEKEQERQRTIQRLQSEGLMGLQKELELPVLPCRLAVISAEDAAGYRDFMRHIEENPYGFKFEIVLFPALMQGVDCPASIIAALDAILYETQGNALDCCAGKFATQGNALECREGEFNVQGNALDCCAGRFAVRTGGAESGAGEFAMQGGGAECVAWQRCRGYDAVLILRGGGAKLDLACFDDYNLAAVIAQYPLPVLTAIGHDQDYHVCDMVAHEFLKTPTALADYIIDIYAREDERISSFESRIRLALSNRLYREEALLDSLSARIKGGFSLKITKEEALLESLAARIKGGFSLKIAAMESALQVLQTRIQAADPRKILDRGYALAVDENGVVLKSVAGRQVGDKVSVMFADGILHAEVVSVAPSAKP